jgi:hypothetical protein
VRSKPSSFRASSKADVMTLTVATSKADPCISRWIGMSCPSRARGGFASDPIGPSDCEHCQDRGAGIRARREIARLHFSGLGEPLRGSGN